ncbi:YnhF family membrane protein [Entomohabitans teleogrylli]|nr:YnhF family membrane protein [Entomohabitans teleogrylli]
MSIELRYALLTTLVTLGGIVVVGIIAVVH